MRRDLLVILCELSVLCGESSRRTPLSFGLVALLLACLGLYGVTAYSVSRRAREIGLRMAVGASRGRVLTLILRGAMVQLLIGAAIGLPAALTVGWLLQSRLFGISAYDPLVFGAGVTLLGASAVIAALLPASRAAGMDPVRAMRLD